MDTFTEFLTSTSPAVALSLALLKASLLLAVIQLLVRMSHFSAAIRHLLLTAGIAGFLLARRLADPASRSAPAATIRSSRS